MKLVDVAQMIFTVLYDTVQLQQFCQIKYNIQKYR
jgi:hypothetical protein